ncbi:trigger factor [Oscillatoria amoena NRMC-F 0135]|nr:trigger factor [Desertifilum sp.]MDI9640376.1 trigger factor [Geitlerinema splendidum]MDL5044744.1 trigger factor [Oscillatoria amoena NRMC-F 0135]
MKVTQEKLPQSQMGLEIEVPAEMSKQAYDRVVQNMIRSANIPGFRKGKVPRQVVMQRFGARNLKAAAVEDLIQKVLPEAIEQEKIQAIGNYQLRSDMESLIEAYEPGQPLTFSAAVDVPPEVTLNQYTELTVQAEEVKYDAGKVDRLLEEQRQRQATLIPVEGRPASLGDVALVDFMGYTHSEDGELQEIPGGQAEDFEIELDQNRFIPGFVDGILGMNPGDTKEVIAQFPEDYPQEEVAGKSAQFQITLKELKEKELPELDDEFAQEVSEFETLEELRASLEKRYQDEADSKTKENKERSLLDELLNHIEVEIPESMIQREVDSMLTQTAMQLANQGLDIKRLFTAELIPQLREQSRPEALKRIKRALTLAEIAKRESLSVEAEAIDAKVQEIMTEYAGRQELDPERLREAVEDDLIKEKILTWLEEHCTVELVPEGTLKSEEDEETIEETEVDEELASSTTADS